MQEAMLQLEGITRQFKDLKAVNALDLQVNRGEFFGLLGPNGAGKTTTIHMISGIMPPDAGRILLKGEPLYPSTGKYKLLMGVVPQEIALYEELSALKNLVFWGGLYGMNQRDAKRKAEELLEWVGLSDRKNDQVMQYSGGMKRRVNIAAALMHDPELILMDEPTVGIDPQSRNKIYGMLHELHQGGKTIIYTTHYMNEAESMCDRIGIIDQGKLIGYGTLDELRKDHGNESAFRVVFSDQSLSIDLPEHLSYNLNKENSELRVVTKHTHRDLSIVLQHLKDNNIDITDIHIEQSNLETIFLNLTGRTLRE